MEQSLAQQYTSYWYPASSGATSSIRLVRSGLTFSRLFIVIVASFVPSKTAYQLAVRTLAQDWIIHLNTLVRLYYIWPHPWHFATHGPVERHVCSFLARIASGNSTVSCSNLTCRDTGFKLKWWLEAHYLALTIKRQSHLRFLSWSCFIVSHIQTDRQIDIHYTHTLQTDRDNTLHLYNHILGLLLKTTEPSRTKNLVESKWNLQNSLARRWVLDLKLGEVRRRLTKARSFVKENWMILEWWHLGENRQMENYCTYMHIFTKVVVLAGHMFSRLLPGY